MKSKLEMFVKVLYLPFFLIVGNGIAIYMAEQDYSKFALAAWVGLLIAVSFLIEQWMPFSPEFNKPQADSGRDVIHALVNESLCQSLLVLSHLIQFGPPTHRCGCKCCWR